MAEENQNAGGLLLLHNAMEQQESKAQWQPRQQQQASLPYQGTGGAASGHTPCGAPSAGDPAGAAAKAAAIREKNRLAQQRFRERQRLKEAEADEQCAALQLQIDEVHRHSHPSSSCRWSGLACGHRTLHPSSL
jgi:hypothetical protein